GGGGGRGGGGQAGAAVGWGGEGDRGRRRGALVWEEGPTRRRRVMVAGFEGGNDAASAASEAAGWLPRRFDATKFASMNPEEHFDFQSARPTVELVDGVTRDLTWPATEFFAVPVDARALVVLRGVEPNLRWPAV